MVIFEPPLPLMPAAKNSGTRLFNRTAASVLFMQHSSDVDDTTLDCEHGAIVDQSEVDGP